MAEDFLEAVEDSEDLLGDVGEVSSDAPKKKFNIRQFLGARKKLLLIIFLVLLILGVGAGAAWFFLFSGSSEEPVEAVAVPVMTDASVQAAIEKSDEAIFEDVIVLAPFQMLQLKGASAMGYINLDITLELINPNDRKIYYPMEERVRKIVEARVRDLTWLELRNPEGKIKLKYELLRQMNGLFNRPIFRNLYFTKFLMQ